MAYKKTKAASCGATFEPAVLCTVITNAITATEYAIKVPWDNCKLVYIYSLVSVVIDGTGDMVIKFEKDAASGERLADMTVAASSAVATLDEATLTLTRAGIKARHQLNHNNIINVEVDGSSSGTGQLNLYLYFEAM
jgi:hypothetical protein